MISAGMCRANSSATAVLPTAVGPVITRACEKENRRSITGREFLTRRFPAPQTMRFSKNCNGNFCLSTPAFLIKSKRRPRLCLKREVAQIADHICVTSHGKNAQADFSAWTIIRLVSAAFFPSTSGAGKQSIPLCLLPILAEPVW